MKSDFSRKILYYLVLAGAVSIAATSPFFLSRLAKVILKDLEYKAKNKQKFSDAFSYLRRKEYIIIEKNGHDISITPTKKGMNLVKKHKVLEIEIKRPKKWDGKIRIVAFDIPNSQRIKRNAFRYKLKELGFYSSQKSVWLHPFECKNEIKILKEFFGLNDKQIQFFTAGKMVDSVLLEKIRSAYKI